MADQRPDGVVGTHAGFDPAASAALIAEQRARVEAATDVDGRLLFATWGIAWLLGFGLLWAVGLDEPVVAMSRGAALAVFFGLLIAAMVVTAVHLARQTTGVRGTSAVQGAMYGWSWFLGFAVIAALSRALAVAGASSEVVTITTTIVPALLVGSLYMAGGAIWADRTQFVLGAWICLAATLAAVVGLPHLLLVMALAGGGGMLATAVVVHVLRRRVGVRR